MMNALVDEYLNNVKKWRLELEELRSITLDCNLTEEFKWKNPCYTYKKSNVVILGGFKDYCALMFFKGALLSDPENILVQQTENVQSGRQIRFSNLEEIKKNTATLKAYIYEAIKVEKSGLKVIPKKNNEIELPLEVQKIFAENPILKSSFEALTLGRQRAYNLFFSAPKQSKTIISRVESSSQRILNGKGLNDCTCGLSKRMPGCDGSHKILKGNY